MKELELLKEARKMCEAQTDCASCGLHEDCFFTCRPRFITDAMIEEYCSEVEKWSNAHQPKTNAQKFEEVFGHKPKFYNGTYYCPPSTTVDSCDAECKTCIKWWDEPYKEPERGER